jgi:hypothetical protein
LTSVGISGTINFNGPTVSVSNLPNSSAVRLPPGQPHTATITVKNTGNAPALFAIDPRLNQSHVYTLASLTDTNGPLPVTDFGKVPQFVVPPYTTRIDMTAQAADPAVLINFDPSPAFGWPELTSNVGNPAVVDYSAPDIPASLWAVPPTEVTTGAAVSTTFTAGATAVTNTFDTTASPSTGNTWLWLEGQSNNYAPKLLNPGQTASITVTIVPSGSSGTVVSGFLSVETFNFNTVSSDILTRVPYSYTIQ